MNKRSLHISLSPRALESLRARADAATRTRQQLIEDWLTGSYVHTSSESTDQIPVRTDLRPRERKKKESIPEVDAFVSALSKPEPMQAKKPVVLPEKCPRSGQYIYPNEFVPDHKLCSCAQCKQLRMQVL